MARHPSAEGHHELEQGDIKLPDTGRALGFAARAAVRMEQGCGRQSRGVAQG